MKSLFLLTLLLYTAESIIAQSTPVKKVLMEEFTTTLCGFCPPKSHDIVNFHESNSGNTIFMTHHAGFGIDSMTNPQASAFASFFSPAAFGFAPAIMIDRDIYPWVDSIPYMSVSGFDTITTTVMQQQPVVGITFSGTYNAFTRKLTVTVSSNFVQVPSPGDIRLNVFFVEDSVIGTGYGWDQKCYDANWANQYYPGQYNSSTTYISDYPHRYVQRGPLGGGTWGPAGIIPVNPVPGVAYDYTVTANVPLNYNENQLKVVAFVANYGATKFDRNVLNANEIKLSDFTLSGINEPGLNSAIDLYPNPAVEYFKINTENFIGDEATLLITDLRGRQVMNSILHLPHQKGYMEIPCSLLTNGYYLVAIQNGNRIGKAPLIISR